MNPLDRCVQPPILSEATWDDHLAPTVRVDDRFTELQEAVTDLQEAFTRSNPSADVAASVAADLRAITRTLAQFEVDEDDQLAGRLWERPGRGQTMAPAMHFDEVTPISACGHVTINRFHSGRYALQGGVTPMIFDEMLSRLGNSGRDWARTANLSVDYRAPAPLHRRLTVTGEFVRQEGRKRYLRGAMYDGDLVVAEATGLWVVTKP